VTLAVTADLRRRFGLRDLEPETERTMTEERMALIELVEKQADGDLVREMLAFAAGRIMEAEVELQTGAAKGARTPMREVQRRRPQSGGYRVRDSTRLWRTAPSDPIAQSWKLPFPKWIASMLIVVVTDVPSIRF
jgi:hypothetical protein